MMQSKDYSKKIITVPNVISMFRLLLIPVFVWTYVRLHDNLLTVILLTVSGISDIADGFIARRFNMVSDLGKALDPVADKLTQLAMLTCLVYRYKYMLIPLLLLAVKEIIAGTTGLAVIKATNRVLGAEWHGKLATVSLYVMMAIHMVWPIVAPPDIPQTVSIITVAVATALVLLSFVLYTVRNIRLIKDAQAAENGENNKEEM